jgi:hypothetical protein
MTPPATSAIATSRGSRNAGIAPEGAIPDGGETGRDQSKPVGAEVQQQGEQGRDVEHHAEREALQERVVPAEQRRHHDQVP